MPVDPLELNLGAMRHSIAIQSQGAATPNPTTGSPQQAWCTIRSTSASISTVSSKELYLAGQFSDQATHLIVVRYTPVALNATMRVLFGSRVFIIQNVENVQERNIRLNLICQEIDGVSS